MALFLQPLYLAAVDLNGQKTHKLLHSSQIQQYRQYPSHRLLLLLYHDPTHSFFLHIQRHSFSSTLDHRRQLLHFLSLRSTALYLHLVRHMAVLK
jgi:hypothetical protein